MPSDQKQTYDFICFSDLVYEFSFSDKKSIEQKIKRRLKYYKLGDYQQERVDYIRNLKDDLYGEISSRSKSKYYTKSNSTFSELRDFDIPKMNADYSAKYHNLSEREIETMINFAIYLYHLR